MNIVSLVLVMTAQIGGNQAPPEEITLKGGILAHELRMGPGKLLEEGDKISIQYRVWDSLHRELANSTKRGLPYTLLVGARNSDPLVSVVLDGMHEGGIRTAVIPSEMIPLGVGSIIPAKTDLHLWIHVIAAKPFQQSKVESAHAERTQGTVEVPRAFAHHGAART